MRLLGTLRHLLSPTVLVHVLLLRPLLKLLFGVHVEGREHLARLERFVLVANHNSHLDVLLLFHVLTVEQILRTHPVAALEYFSRSRVVLWLVDHLLQPVWIVRGARDADPLEGMRQRLTQGRSLVVFPEGTRGEAGEIARFKSGVARLAAEYPDVPVVPAFLSGPERALPKSRSLLVPVWNQVTIGPPRYFEGTHAAFTAELEAAVQELADAQAHGRHRRRVRARRVPAVAVLGIDGSGKSTLSRTLARRLSAGGRACLVTDEVEVFEDGERRDVPLLLAERLRTSFGRKAKAAGSLRSYKIPKLAEILLRDHVVEELRRWYAPDVIVQDGSALLNLAAWTRLYQEKAFDEAVCLALLKVLSGRDDSIAEDHPVFELLPELATFRRLRLGHLVVPDAALFLDVDPAVSMERIRTRGEAQQAHETADRLTRLRGGYLMACAVAERELGVPTQTIDGQLGAEVVADRAMEELRRAGLTPSSETDASVEGDAAKAVGTGEDGGG